jgi:hypothetical protein
MLPESEGLTSTNNTVRCREMRKTPRLPAVRDQEVAIQPAVILEFA